MSQDDFVKVSHKRKNKKFDSEVVLDHLKHLTINNHLSPSDKESAIRRILQAKDDLATSDYYSSVKASLREAHSLLEVEPSKASNFPFAISELVCFGIGHFLDCMISRYQFAFILQLAETHNFSTVKVCDPILSDSEYDVLRHFNIEAIKENIEAKYVANQQYTLFYLPHCPKQLSNNLLWANWSRESLSECMILSNSFHSLIESNTKRAIVESAEYVLKISPYVTEIAIINCFKYYDMFNEAALHVFPNLGLLPADFWTDNDEPSYAVADVEYIANNLLQI